MFTHPQATQDEDENKLGKLYHYFTCSPIILCSEWVPSVGLKSKHLNEYLSLANTQLFYSQDANCWTGVLWITSVLM